MIGNKKKGRQCINGVSYDAEEFGLSVDYSYILDRLLCYSMADGLKRAKTGGRKSSQKTRKQSGEEMIRD